MDAPPAVGWAADWSGCYGQDFRVSWIAELEVDQPARRASVQAWNHLVQLGDQAFRVDGLSCDDRTQQAVEVWQGVLVQRLLVISPKRDDLGCDLRGVICR